MLIQLDETLWCYQKNCNVYILRVGEKALLINCGDGSVLETLAGLGIKKVDWVLFTHHHRELCSGAAKIKATGARLAMAESEQDLLEHPEKFRKGKPSLEDPYTCYGTSYLRLPIDPVQIDLTFANYGTFIWEGYEFWCMATPGASPGAMSYLWREDNSWKAFTGNLVRCGAKMHFWFDSEWDYGYAGGLTALHESTFAVERFQPKVLFPAHGGAITNPSEVLPAYRAKLRRATELLLRDWDMRYPSQAADVVSLPTTVPHLWQVSEHLYKFTGSGFGGNFHMLLSDNGHALFIDCGLWENEWLDKCISLMKERLGLRQIDAVIATHMHGDHLLNIPHLKKRYTVPLWTLDVVKDKMEHPNWFNLVAAPDVYPGMEPIEADRIFTSGEKLNWEGHQLTFDWFPGQTQFALILYGMIDGKKVAFTGDNIFRNPQGNGHDALYARAGGLLDEGYAYTAKYLEDLSPDLILAGHSVVIENPSLQLDKYVEWGEEMRHALQELSPFENEKIFFDPYLLRAQPYRSYVKAGESGELTLFLRNHSELPQAFCIRPHFPSGWKSDFSVWEGEFAANEMLSITFSCTVPTHSIMGSYAVVFDITLGDQHFGELFDALVFVEN